MAAPSISLTDVMGRACSFGVVRRQNAATFLLGACIRYRALFLNHVLDGLISLVSCFLFLVSRFS